MSITSIADYQAAHKQSVRMLQWYTNVTSPDVWVSMPTMPATGNLAQLPAIGNKTTGLVPVAGGTGFPAVQTFSGAGYLTRIIGSIAIAANNCYYRMRLCDRLWHAGTFSTLDSYPQAIASQPSFTGRLPGSGHVGLQLWYENLTNSNTGSITIEYTNENGTTGRSTTMAFGSISQFVAQQVPLQAGDYGIQKVDAITAYSGGTSNYQLAIVRPLYMGRFDYLRHHRPEVVHGMGELGMPEVFPTSALMLYGYRETSNTTTGPALDLDIEIASKP